MKFLVEAISKFRKTRHAYELLQLRKASGRSKKLIWDLEKSQDFYRDREGLFQASSTKQHGHSEVRRPTSEAVSGASADWDRKREKKRWVEAGHKPADRVRRLRQ